MDKKGAFALLLLVCLVFPLPSSADPEEKILEKAKEKIEDILMERGESTGERILCCDPRSHGFWHRQCLGMGRIEPGKGKGPPMHPSFNARELDRLFAEVSRELAFSGQRTCEAINPDPPSDPCERALGQLAALLLNVKSGLLSSECALKWGEDDLAHRPGKVSEAVRIMKRLISTGEFSKCRSACFIGEAVNSGRALEERVRCGGCPPHDGEDEIGDEDNDSDEGDDVPPGVKKKRGYGKKKAKDKTKKGKKKK